MLNRFKTVLNERVKLLSDLFRLIGYQIVVKVHLPLFQKPPQRLLKSTSHYVQNIIPRQSSTLPTIIALPQERFNPPPEPLCRGGEFPNKWKWIFTHKANHRFCAIIPNARVIQNSSSDATVIADESGNIFYDLNPLFKFSETNFPFHYFFSFRAPVRIPGKSLFLSTDSCRNYYHWMCDSLPKIKVLHDAGIDLNEFDNIIIDNKVSKFQIETISLLGLSKKIISLSELKNIRCDFLYAPSLVDQSGVPRTDSTQWLSQKLISGAIKKNNARKPRKLFIYRDKNATVGGRHIVNWDELSERLGRLGFDMIACEKLSVASQIKAFNSSSCIVGVHGAALTNIMFCRPGTKVIEIVEPRYSWQMFWVLADTMNLDYSVLYGTPVNSQSRDPDVYLDPDRLLDALDTQPLPIA